MDVNQGIGARKMWLPARSFLLWSLTELQRSSSSISRAAVYRKLWTKGRPPARSTRARRRSARQEWRGGPERSWGATQLDQCSSWSGVSRPTMWRRIERTLRYISTKKSHHQLLLDASSASVQKCESSSAAISVRQCKSTFRIRRMGKGL